MAKTISIDGVDAAIRFAVVGTRIEVALIDAVASVPQIPVAAALGEQARAVASRAERAERANGECQNSNRSDVHLSY
ncbi:MAG: hypothetical protein ACKV2T_05920 [Kofleriaceae bacterium]